MTSRPAPGHGQGGFGGPRVVAAAVAVVLVGLVGGEAYARHHASGLVAGVVRCEIHDGARVSFGATPLVLWQYLSRHYRHIAVHTAGHRVRDAKGMRIDLDIHDVRLRAGADSLGTIAAIDGAFTWSADGIKQSIRDAVPTLGTIATGGVTTHPGDGTIELKGLLDSAVVRPRIVNGGLSLQVVSLSARGHHLQIGGAQHDLDDLTAKATRDYRLGIHADRVRVTDTGVVTEFSTQNAAIPRPRSPHQNSCFDAL